MTLHEIVSHLVTAVVALFINDLLRWRRENRRRSRDLENGRRD